MNNYHVLTMGGLRPLTPSGLHKWGAAYEGRDEFRAHRRRAESDCERDGADSTEIRYEQRTHSDLSAARGVRAVRVWRLDAPAQRGRQRHHGRGADGILAVPGWINAHLWVKVFRPRCTGKLCSLRLTEAAL